MGAVATLYQGANAALRDLRKIQAFAPDEFARALYQEAQIELTEIKKRTPVDTGALRASERLEGPNRNGRQISVTVLAGGPSAPYAFFVHEDLEAYHKQGEARYIENPLKESAPYLPARVAKRIDLNRAL
jgi:hypothetical protein